MERRIELRQLVNIFALFMIVQFLGMLLLIAVILPTQAPILIESVSEPGTIINVLWLITYLMIINIVVFMFFSKYKGDLLFKFLDLYIIIVPTFFLFLFIFGSLFTAPSDLYFDAAAALAVGIALAAAKHKMQKLRNFAVIIASVSIGVVLGYILPFWGAYILMLAIAVYDYVAVFVTKHMVALAKVAANRNLSLFIGSADVEAIPKSYLSREDQNEIKKTFKMSEIKNPQLRDIVKEGSLPVVSQILLGGGDLGVPLMMAASAYTTYLSFFLTSMIIVGAAFGLLLTMYIAKRYKVALPAIPPLFFAISLASAAAFAITGVINWQVKAAAIIGIIFIIPMYIALRNKG